ncbi:BglG family transcription antiterminator [Enterococcus sp. AZ103]|uniref:BglG family transcription antiterminator n=1 Tax=Enterococcus sp. AZ103 TaxID=2774628 RepID=UPI003F237905
MQQLSKRELRILLYLLENSEPVTTQKLADEEAVSVRTVKYALDNIRLWLKERRLQLGSKRSQGIWIEVNGSERMKLKSEMMAVDRLELFPDQGLRLDRLIIQLSLSKSATTAQELADRLKVSKDTIMNDFVVLEEKLARREMELSRQTGKGFSITGTEREIRLLIEEVLQQGFTDYDIYRIMELLLQGEECDRYEIYSASQTLLQEVFNQAIVSLRELLAVENLDELNYSELLNMLIRVSVAATRIQSENTIGGYQLLQTDQINREELAYQLMSVISAKYHLPLFEDEYRYIYSDTFDSGPQQDVMTLTKEIISQVSENQNYPYNQDPVLLTNLYAHLSLRFTRKQKYVNEYNPFKDEIKANYPSLFAAIERAVKKEMIDESLLVNDSFIAYIALHFLVSFEKETDSRRVRAVYVCSTGLGVTSLIKQKISEELSNLEVAAFASVLNAQEIVKKKNPDLVISIFPIEGVDRPFVKVHPLPTKEDLRKIQVEIKRILGQDNQKTPNKLGLTSGPINHDSAESCSKDLILKGYTVYERLLVLLKDHLIIEYREGFLLHVLLLVHRITFEQQYILEGGHEDQRIMQQKNLVEQIEALFAENNLAINKSEIHALFAYLREE